MIDPAHRQVLVQETPSRLSGAELAEFITFASTLFEPGTETEVFFPPMLRKEDILAFFNYSALERIASVSMEVVRPNHGWTDYYNLLTSFADESNASIAKVEMSAPRNRSLQQQTGIIAIFLSLVTATPGLLQHFRIHTVLTGQHDLTVLDLHDYRIRTEEQLDLSTNPGSASQQIQQRLIEMEPSEKVREEPSPVPA
jgi:hypothetical protein